MKYRILVPSGIGDFSWLWSKLSTTEHQYFVEYAYMYPDRLGAFLPLLPKDKLLGFKTNKDYRCWFDTLGLEMHFAPGDESKVNLHSQLVPGDDVLNLIEPNTHLERGNRIETWLPDVPATDLHYKIGGLLERPVRQNIFLVHLSSVKVRIFWNYYDVPVWVDMVEAIQKKTGWLPIFIGGDYDDFAQECFEQYIQKNQAISLIGKTPNLVSVLCLIQQSRFFMGAVSSGLTMLANVLNTPSVSWWPRPGLPPSWPDTNIPYLWFLWKNPDLDKEALLLWLKNIA